jgi:FkbM family methyltransferase
MGKYLRYKLFEKVKWILFKEFPKSSYSRSGEDLLLDEIFNYKASGFYVDVGAFHPIKYSNTFKFYLKGWTGINIEPNLELISQFKGVRPNDINLNLAINEQPGFINYYMNDADPSMNTVSADFAQNSKTEYNFDTSEIRVIEAKTLASIFSDPKNLSGVIDFLGVDVEGHDLNVLRSNNWEIFRPHIVMVELNCSINDVIHSDIYNFLVNKNYTLLSYTFLNMKVGNAFFMNNG